jgi:DNA-binding transcriptional LysR family regulator
MYRAAVVTGRPAARTPAARRRRPVALAGLRGFDAAARHLSFTLAAEELALTQSSVSRQVAALERQVGTALFVRKTRALALTAAGARLHAAVAQALAGIDRGVAEIRGTAHAPRVSLTTYASFASLWLVPRLASFQRAHPRIEIRIDASDRQVDLQAEGLDVAIRRCRPPQVAGLPEVTPLHDEVVLPALNPQLLERQRMSLAGPADLLRLPLIDLDDPGPSSHASSWARWFEHAGVRSSQPEAGRLTFGFVDQAVQAAVRGQGVVLGRSPLLDESLATGQLSAPFPELRLATGFRYYLLVNPDRAKSPEVAAFARWLVEEFERGPQRFS